MSRTKCGRCGKPPTGYAGINGVRFCHGDDDPSPTCYELGNRGLAVPAGWPPLSDLKVVWVTDGGLPT